jgi:predicted aspartyl protease
MKDYKAFTVKGNGRINQLVTQCGVSHPHDPRISKNPVPPVKHYEAIWDTGATGTVITKKVVDELGLVPTGKTTSIHAGGSDEVNTYLINVYLPNGIAVPGVRVITAVLTGNAEMLIGMDIISLGDFSITNLQGKTCFSFRIPSIQEVDFVEEFKKTKSTPTWLQRKDKRGYPKKR